MVVVGDVLLVVVLLRLMEDVVGGVEGAEVAVVVDGSTVSQSLPNGKQSVNKFFSPRQVNRVCHIHITFSV